MAGSRSPERRRISVSLAVGAIAALLLGVLALVPPVTATVAGVTVDCPGAITSFFPSDPGIGGFTPVELACREAAANRSAWFFVALVVSVGLVVVGAVLDTRHRRSSQRA